jgi:hypothetical protein
MIEVRVDYFVFCKRVSLILKHTTYICCMGQYLHLHLLNLGVEIRKMYTITGSCVLLGSIPPALQQ